MQLLTKNGKPIIDRVTKPQATKALTHGKINESWKNEIKEVLFTSKLAGIKSSMKSLELQLT